MKKKNSYSFKQFFNSRFSLYAMLIVITISFICTYSKVYDVKLDLNGDNIHYYALGKALTEGKGFTNIYVFQRDAPHPFPSRLSGIRGRGDEVFPQQYQRGQNRQRFVAFCFNSPVILSIKEIIR